MIAYKLVKLRKNGSLGSLFIGCKNILELDCWYECQDIPTKGYSHRPGWHCTLSPKAPHLSENGRIWVKVEILHYTILERPSSQGGKWALAKYMKILEVLGNR